MKCLMYLRVATKQQTSREGSIEGQKKACLAFIKRHHYRINSKTDLYIDAGVSGLAEERPAFQSMMERLKKDRKIKAVIAYDIHRISRNISEYLNFKQTLKELDKKFFSVSGSIVKDDSTKWLRDSILANFEKFRSLPNREQCPGCSCICHETE